MVAPVETFVQLLGSSIEGLLNQARGWLPAWLAPTPAVLLAPAALRQLACDSSHSQAVVVACLLLPVPPRAMPPAPCLGPAAHMHSAPRRRRPLACPQMRADRRAQLAAAGLADESEDEDEFYPASLPPWCAPLCPLSGCFVPAALVNAAVLAAAGVCMQPASAARLLGRAACALTWGVAPCLPSEAAAPTALLPSSTYPPQHPGQQGALQRGRVAQDTLHPSVRQAGGVGREEEQESGAAVFGFPHGSSFVLPKFRLNTAQLEISVPLGPCSASIHANAPAMRCASPHAGRTCASPTTT